MKLTVLTENNAGGSLLAEHGLSYLIELNSKKYLFDTGHSNVFLKNAQSLGINLQTKVDTVILSHGHWDHGNGLRFLKNKRLIAHTNIFMSRYRKHDKTPLGLTLSKTETEALYDTHLHDHPYLIENGLLFLGEIPRETDFESQTTPFVDEQGKPDFVIDDTAIVAIEKGHLNIVTGCSHAGICNIIKHAKDLTGCNKINAVIGGFHLKHNNRQTQKTVAYLKANKVKHIYPSHCTELPALAAFYNTFNISQLKTGSIINV